jgi:anti-sigma B factor antagonist
MTDGTAFACSIGAGVSRTDRTSLRDPFPETLAHIRQFTDTLAQILGESMAVKTTTLQSGSVGVIEVKGSLVGGEETDELSNAVADFVEQGNKKLIIDLSKVDYLNSTAIGVLVKAHTTYKKHQGQVKLCGINKNINNIFVITKLTMVFEVAETREDAIKAFA